MSEENRNLKKSEDYLMYLSYDSVPIISKVDELKYYSVKDYTFENWFVLKNGVSLKTAILAWGKAFDRKPESYGRSAIRIVEADEERAMAEFSEDKSELTRLCQRYHITLIRKDGHEYHNYMDGKNYRIVEQEGYGEIDDAAMYLFRLWEQVLPPEIQAEVERKKQENRKRAALWRGRSICNRYCIQNMKQLQEAESRASYLLNIWTERLLEAKGYDHDSPHGQHVREKREECRRMLLEIETAKKWLEYNE